jgi:hypothetical protein
MSRRQPHTLTNAERGYGRAHQAKRAEYKTLVDRGGVKCYRCGKFIQPGQPFHLDHADVPGAHQRGIYAGASHPWCNLAARNRRIAALARQAQARGPATPAPEKPHVAPALRFFDVRTPNNTATTPKPPAAKELPF